MQADPTLGGRGPVGFRDLGEVLAHHRHHRDQVERISAAFVKAMGSFGVRLRVTKVAMASDPKPK